ncbi:uncharacterized protein LOC108093266 [Drosophila ficusphila]|uniref:uncharacterized protein LOC108093266 n=1 Tax=Drosophila ficusphila TaxID=30025 RepID=UPI0007E8759D|nr:uncharacterized protein LOC108093266 [Drosophila ficusphila]
MFECSRCGHQKRDLRINSDSGATSWCSNCHEQTFFMKSKLGSKPTRPKEGVSSNWAVEAVDPPKSVGSFSVLPNRFGIVDRNLIKEVKRVQPPAAQLDSSSNPRSESEERTPRNSSPAKAERRSHSKTKSQKSEEIKGIERLRSTPPPHLEPYRSLSPVNPYVNLSKQEDTSSDESLNPNMRKLQPRLSPDEFNGPETSQQARDRNRRLSSGSEVERRLFENLYLGPVIPNENQRFLDPVNPYEEDNKASQIPVENISIQDMRKLHWPSSTDNFIGLQTKPPKNHSLRLISESIRRYAPSLKLQRRFFTNQQNNRKVNSPRTKIETVDSSELIILQENSSSKEQIFRETGGAQLNKKKRKESKSSIEVSISKSFVKSLREQKALKNKDRKKRSSRRYSASRYSEPRTESEWEKELERLEKDGTDRKNSATGGYTIKELCVLASTVQRAEFDQIEYDPLEMVKYMKSLAGDEKIVISPPKPQFSTVECLPEDLPRLLAANPFILKRSEPKVLDISRSPIRCPDADCRRLCFVSDLNNHLLLDHGGLLLERIKPRETKTFFLDVNLTRLDQPKCHIVYMVRDKVIDTQGEILCDLLPVMLMTARTQYHLVIWLMTIVPRNFRPRATIAVFPTTAHKDWGNVVTSHIYDIRASHQLEAICQAPFIMRLPVAMINRMTENKTRFLGIQVQVY